MRTTGTYDWGKLVHFALSSLRGISIKKKYFGGK